MTELRLGTIGVGGMGAQHARMFAEHPRARVVCVCDVDEDKAKAAAAAIGAEHTTDYRRLIERDDIDAVLVSVPNKLHFVVAQDCIKAGKHTAVQYPVTQTVKEYDTLFAEADRRGVILHDILTPTIEPQPLKMRELAPRLGKIMAMRSVYVGGARGSWYTNTERRGNFYAALTIHNIVYYNVLMAQTPDWVSGALHQDDSIPFHSGFYTCHYPSGALGFNEWHMGAEVGGVWNWWVEGEKGRMAYDRERFGDQEIRLLTADGEESFAIGEMSDAHEVAVEGFVNLTLGDTREPYVDRRFSRDVVRLCEAALRSATEGRCLDIE